MTKSEIPSLALQILFQALSWSLGANTSLFPKFHSNFKIPRRNPIKFYPNSNPRASLFFNSNSIRILKCSNKESCSLFHCLQSHILFENFQAREVCLFTESIQTRLMFLAGQPSVPDQPLSLRDPPCVHCPSPASTVSVRYQPPTPPSTATSHLVDTTSPSSSLRVAPRETDTPLPFPLPAGHKGTAQAPFPAFSPPHHPSLGKAACMTPLPFPLHLVQAQSSKVAAFAGFGSKCRHCHPVW
jgi:hypothetical protein